MGNSKKPRTSDDAAFIKCLLEDIALLRQTLQETGCGSQCSSKPPLRALRTVPCEHLLNIGNDAVFRRSVTTVRALLSRLLSGFLWPEHTALFQNGQVSTLANLLGIMSGQGLDWEAGVKPYKRLSSIRKKRKIRDSFLNRL